MNEEILISLYRERGLDEQAQSAAVLAVIRLEDVLAGEGNTLEEASADRIRLYIESLSADRDPSADDLLAMARYFYLTGRPEIYQFFTTLFGGAGVLESIRERAEKLEGHDTAERLFQGVTVKPAGTSPEHLPPCASALTDNLMNILPPERYRRILAGNHHRIPESSFDKEREYLQRADSIDAYLKDRHVRMVDELQDHCNKNKIWYEQLITQEVVDFVSENQEILSAVRRGDALYITKIPYDPAQWLIEKDPEKKRYLACHCPFAREAVRKGEGSPPADWCYCSCGFEKWMFDNLFGMDLEVELLESVLLGNDKCRFAVRIQSASIPSI